MATDEGVTTSWDGYSDYETVSRRIAGSIHDAVEAYATVERAHAERAKIKPEVAARAGSRIMAAAMSVRTELAAYKDDNDDYAELLEKFEGEDGYVAKLKEAQLRTECPDWLFEFVSDIRRAGFLLGYLKAGREDKQREDDGPDAEAREMFANL